MVLSRIWSAFIIIAIGVAAIRMASGDEKIFNRMVVGKSSDKYDSVFYASTGSFLNQKLSSNYAAFLKEYGYFKTDSAQQASILLTDNLANDSIALIRTLNPGIKTYTYVSVQKNLTRKVDGIIETAKRITPNNTPSEQA